MNDLSKEQRKLLELELDNLNNLVGTPYLDNAKRHLISLIPQGYNLDFGLHSMKYCIVDYMGARVI